MGGLDALLRLRRHKVEAGQKRLGALYREMEALLAAKDGLLVERARERTVAQDNIDTLRILARYEAACLQRLEDMAQQQSALEARIDRARQALREAFLALKQVEIITESRHRAAKALKAKKESATLDAIGLEGHRRREQ